MKSFPMKVNVDIGIEHVIAKIHIMRSEGTTKFLKRDVLDELRNHIEYSGSNDLEYLPWCNYEIGDETEDESREKATKIARKLFPKLFEE